MRGHSLVFMRQAARSLTASAPASTTLRGCAAFGRKWSSLHQKNFHTTTKREKDYTFPAKRLVFEDMNAAAGGDAEKIKTLTAENKDLKNRVLVALADVENMRQRTKKSAEEDKKFAVRSFAKGMLEVADCLEKALEAVPEEKRSVSADLQNVYEGMELIDKVFLKALREAQITKFHPLNEKFNPESASALFEMPADGKEPGMIGHVIKSGYMIHDRVLRPAEVGVTK
mmetsp:Transcript_2863/g.4074  ORF Transcript_2863/g.4074 Transcript_2863/m.4074 type:complete len:228 (+) Transcript_2863:13-696(+)|eukprot:CAMPEP_0179438934 /NCGR_PEP_ID=MMETSP0799-20121207/22594_1 /TAXON_ID=46947 /ORGANISM="Geminigera cryophila, Strain CCMP2564" /LENGTH=227 /DNA_ID=CAMNT_0021220901 /DNA_START=13 /DNA_END=696 /DNA_ORIENTATION=-